MFTHGANSDAGALAAVLLVYPFTGLLPVMLHDLLFPQGQFRPFWKEVELEMRKQNILRYSDVCPMLRAFANDVPSGIHTTSY